MANQQLTESGFGSVTFDAGGKSYTIRFTQNALYRLEQKLGRPLWLALAELNLVTVQTMLWAGLEGARLKEIRSAGLRAGDSIPFTIDQAGDIIDDLGGIAKARPIILEAWRLGLPKAEPKTEGDGEAAPDPSSSQTPNADGMPD